ncbi:MAG: hypothetical protein GYB68_11970 [Chloroflexi bacterium]|nr:hypothetical protein [Chloroflexota bacterium]
MPDERKIGLVVGSGGVKCAASIGLLRVLQQHGVTVDRVVGCSGGSLYAAAIALGFTLDHMIELTFNLWSPDLMKDYRSNLSAFQSGEKRFTEKSGLVDDAVLFAVLTEVFGESTFTDTTIPLHIIAADFMTGERHILEQGRIFDAVRASVAIPAVFPPWEVDGRLLVDGAVVDPLPIDVAIQHRADVIIAMGFELDYRSRMRSMTAVNAHLNSIYINNLLRKSLAFHTLAHHDEIILIIPEFDRPISTFSTDSIPYIVAQGEMAAEQDMAYLKSLLS